MEISRHLCHYDSTCDCSQQPYLVSSPTQHQDCAPLPVVFFLHDTFSPATPQVFIEAGFQQAVDWLTVLECADPCLFVQPFGRGNSGWLGIGASDLFEVLDQIRLQFAIDGQRISIMGIGMGATAALILAGRYPGQFSAVAAIGAWADASADRNVAMPKQPVWEKPVREMISPVGLAENLRSTPIYLEHPWWFRGLNRQPAVAHFEKLTTEFAPESHCIKIGASNPGLTRERQAPVNRRGVLDWLLSHCTPKAKQSETVVIPEGNFIHHRTIKIGRRDDLSAPARITVELELRSVAFTTFNVETFETELAPETAVKIDGQQLEIPDYTEQDRLTFNKFGADWCLIDTEDSPCHHHATFRELHQRPVMFVPGSMGDESENELMAEFAESLAHRWTSGLDSLNPHHGDRSVSFDYKVSRDVDLTNEEISSRDLCLIGNAANNLVIARFRADLPCHWNDSEGVVKSFEIADVTCRNEADAAWFVTSHPLHEDRLVACFTFLGDQAFAHAELLRTAFLPNFFVFRRHRVLASGAFAKTSELARS